MADPNTPKDPAAAPQDAADGSDNLLHELVFKGKKEGAPDEPAAPQSTASAAFGVSPVELDHTRSMRHIGDSDPGDFQPDNGPRR